MALRDEAGTHSPYGLQADIGPGSDSGVNKRVGWPSQVSGKRNVGVISQDEEPVPGRPLSEFRTWGLLIRVRPTRPVPIGPAPQNSTFGRVRCARGSLGERLARLCVKPGSLEQIPVHARNQR